MLTAVEIGHRFGMLSVVASAHKNCIWLCQCDCGRTIKAYTASLSEGRRKSCGCTNQEIQKIQKKKIRKHLLDHFLHVYTPNRL